MDYRKFLSYRQKSDSLINAIKSKQKDKRLIDENFVNRFIQTNPEMFQVYRLLGDWYKATNDNATAVKYWETALTKEIPHLREKEYLEKQIKKVK